MKTRHSPERELGEAVAFALLPRIGCVAFREGVERHGSAAAAFRASEHSSDKRQALAAADALTRKAARLGVSLLVQGETGYPAPLLDLADAPCFLHALGDVSLLERRGVGVVGTRHASASGERTSHQLAMRLVEAGAVVVSGMALGIDAAAHRGALDAGGGTIAVLGCGVDMPYPPAHAALHARIAESGLLLSEAPLGSHPVRGSFPRRNRIIAALSETLIVIEAGDRSGALITSRLALEIGRTVAAVPGPIDSPRHVGSNRLLSDGASFIGSVDDALSIARIEPRVAASTPAQPATPPDVADPGHDEILTAIRSGATDIEDLVRSTLLSPRDFAMALSTLELRGLLRVTEGGTVALAGAK